jgi:putative Mn2+ efflux pump MntP
VSPQRDVPTALVLIVFGSVVAYEAARMPRFGHLAVNPYTVPGIVPGFLALSLVAFGLIMLVRAIVQARRGHAPTHAVDPELRRQVLTRLSLTLLLTVGYALGLVGTIPFWAATFLFVLAFLLAFRWSATREGRPRGVLLAGALLQAGLVAASVTLVFERLFLVRLP